MPDNDNTDSLERRQSDRVRLFLLKEAQGFTPVWTFNDAREGTASLLVDLSLEGCRLLISNEVGLGVARVFIAFDKPDRSDEAYTVVRAEVCRESPAPSLTHREIGCSFIQLDDAQQDALAYLIEQARAQDKPYIRCHVMPQP